MQKLNSLLTLDDKKRVQFQVEMSQQLTSLRPKTLSVIQKKLTVLDLSRRMIWTL
jgi:hypothetical protein